MPSILVTDLSGAERPIDAEEGRSLMEVIRDAGMDEMLALCGGCCSCATCHVHIDEAFLDQTGSMSDDENDLLDSSSSRDACSRLACQVRITAGLEGMRVTLAQDD
ncbi:MAG: 2Fe-2S iron-sulfur cluster-binding protein [Novosphingobium sp.]